MLAAAFAPVAASANGYAASRACQEKELPQAFEIFRGLAELGHLGSQETLAIMYVSGKPWTGDLFAF